MREGRGGACEGLDAAVVKTLPESQSDLGAHAASLETVSADRLQPGVKIRVRGFSKPVIFRRLDGSSAEIEAGPLRMKVALDEITGIEGAATAAKAGSLAARLPSVTVTCKRGERGITGEINV